MKSLLPFLLVAVTSVSANADEVQPACSLSFLVSSVEGMSEAVKAPVLPEAGRDAFRTISLYEPTGATDQFLYAALIDRKKQQAWVYQYGGFGGVAKWYGPLKIDITLAENCPSAKGFVLLGVLTPLAFP